LYIEGYSVQARLRPQHLQRNRPLARDDQGIVVGVDERRPGLRGDRARMHGRIFERRAGDLDLGPMPARVLHLHHRGADRHHDRRRDAEPMRMIGDALRVIAGRHCDHAARLLGVRQVHQLVQRAALLERGRELQVLELQPHGAAEHLRQRAARIEIGVDDVARDRPRGRFDISE
jgi:hypothetical protein